MAQAPDPTREWWTVSDVAAYLGVRTQTVSSYRNRGHMPDSEEMFGRTRVWKPATIIEWNNRRLGRGNWRKS